MNAPLDDLYLPAETLAGDDSQVSLSSLMDFDHVLTIAPMDASPANVGMYHVGTRVTAVSAPECYEPDSGSLIAGDGWEFITAGLTGQHGYNGPWLHDSEIIAGGVARRVLEHATETGGGYYVAVYASYSCEECGGAGVRWNDDQTEELDCPLIATGQCEPGSTTIEGWAIAYRPTDKNGD